MFRARALVPLPIPLVALALTACADPAGYPTLAPRPIEQISLAEPTTPPVDAGTPTAAAERRYAPLLAKVRESDAAFRAALAEARPALAAGRGASVGSDAWGAAQQRLSRLQALRDPVVAAVSDLQAAAADPEAQQDAGLAAAAARAVAEAHAIDAAEADALQQATPRAS